MGGLIRLGIVFLGLVISTVCVSGQDLGSSNKLFGGAKSKSGAKTVKKATPKTTSKTTSKPKPVAAKTTVKTKKPAAAVKKNKSASKNAASKTVVRKTVAPKTASKPRAPIESTTTAKSKFTEFKDARPKNVEITIGRPKEIVNSTTSTNITPSKNTAPSKNVIPANADDQFEEFIESGNVARDDRNYVSAETAYKRAKSLKPRDSRSEYGLGNLYSDQMRWENAERSYRAALLLDSGNAFVYIALSYVLTQPVAAPNLSDRYEEAENLARKAIQLAPSNALAFDQMGVAFELRGLIGVETENAYQKAIKLDSSFAPAYAHLGRLLRRRGLEKESAAAYQNAIERSTNAATMIIVADVMQSEQRFVESEQLLKKALQGDPKNTAGLLMMGRALTTEGKYADAELMLRQSLTVSPNSFMANSLLGDLYARQGKFEQAEMSLGQALSSAASLEKRLLSQQFEAVGDGYLKTGKAANAERVYRLAISLDGERQSLPAKLAKAQHGRS